MIRDMLMKLQKEQAEEAKKAAWCEKEMGKTKQNQLRKSQELQKLKDRKSAAETELSQIVTDLSMLTVETSEMRTSMTAASRQRLAAKTLAEREIAKYKDGTELLGRAVKVLKSYYASKQPTANDAYMTEEQKQSMGAGRGVIGVLEIAVEDFDGLYKETSRNEEMNAKDYNELNQAATVKLASFEKDLEYKGQRKIKLQADISTFGGDLTLLKEEKDAADNYMASLQTQCTIQGPTFEERKARREAELAALNDALNFLRGQTAATTTG